MLFIKYSKDKTKLYESLEKNERFKSVERKAVVKSLDYIRHANLFLRHYSLLHTILI